MEMEDAIVLNDVPRDCFSEAELKGYREVSGRDILDLAIRLEKEIATYRMLDMKIIQYRLKRVGIGPNQDKDIPVIVITSNPKPVPAHLVPKTRKWICYRMKVS